MKVQIKRVERLRVGFGTVQAGQCFEHFSGLFMKIHRGYDNNQQMAISLPDGVVKYFVNSEPVIVVPATLIAQRTEPEEVKKDG